MATPTVAVDFDGVLNTYTGWVGEDVLFDPRPGCEAFLRDLARHYRVVVHTTREPWRVRGWLADHRLAAYVTDITQTKPRAVAYIDDRAVRFDGDYDAALNAVTAPTHWEEP